MASPVIIDPNPTDVAGQVNDIPLDATSVLLTASGSFTFTDDDGGPHTVSVTSASTSSSNGILFGTLTPTVSKDAEPGSAGTVSWNYSVNQNLIDFLALGETITQTYSVTIKDEASTATQAVVVTITGANDAPVLSVEAGDSAAANLTETEGDLNATDTLTVRDVDLSDSVTTDVSVVQTGVTTGGISDAAAAVLFSITASANADATDTNNLTWTFDAGTDAFDYLAAGEVLTLTYTVTVTDGRGVTDTQDVVVTITGTNDAPVITGAIADFGFVEAVDISSQTLSDSGTLSFDDVDVSDTIDVAFSLTSPATWSRATPLDSGLQAKLDYAFSIAGTDNAAPGSVSWTYSATDIDLDFLAAGETITTIYQVTISDSSGATNTQSVVVTITGTNDAPTLTGVETAVSFQENTANAEALLLDNDVTFADPDDNFNGGTVVVTGVLPEDVISVQNQGAGVGEVALIGKTVSYEGVDIGTLSGGDGETLAITLTSAATSAAVDALLQSLTYHNASDLPTLTRDLTITVTDDQNAPVSSTITLTVNPENDRPVLNNLNSSITLHENFINKNYASLISNPDTIGDAFSVYDPEQNYDGGTLTIGGLLNEDFVRVDSQGSDPGQISIVGSTISYGGVAFATESGGGTTATGDRTPIIFTFNDAADNAAIEALIESLQVANPLDAPTDKTRTITFDLLDGDGNVIDYPSVGTTDLRTYKLDMQITLQNDPIQVSGLPTHASFVEDLTGSLDLSALLFTDPDITDSIDLRLTVTAGTLVAEGSADVSVALLDGGRTLTLTGVAADLVTYLSNTNAVRFTGPTDLSGTDVVTLSASATDDGPVTIDLGIMAISLDPTPDAPVLTRMASSVTLAEDLVNSAPQSLGLNVTVTDAEGNFSGGGLTVKGLIAADVVALANTGGISASGTRVLSVRFNDTVIGNVTGGAGTDLIVTFNAAVTPAAVEAVVNALTYKQLTEAPVESHDLFINIIDANGNGLGHGSGVRISFAALSGAENPFNGVDFGINTDPVFVDLDGDGDMDLVVGDVNGELVAYTNQSGNFLALAGNPFAGIDVGARSSPAFADLNSDGRPDLVVGDNLGQFEFYEATDTGFVRQTGANNPLDGIDIGVQGSSKPAFVDLDSDGDLDLVAGGADGLLHVYENTADGFVTPTSWTDPFVQLALGGAGDMSFGSVDLTDLKSSAISVVQSGIVNPYLTSADLASLLRVVRTGADTASWALELNSEAFDYLASGESATLTYTVTFTDKADNNASRDVAITVTGTAGAPVIRLETPEGGVTGNVLKTEARIDVGATANPAFADLDGDGAPDLVIGDANGSLRTFLNNSSGFRELVGSANPFADVDPGAAVAPVAVGLAATPTFVDINGDGTPDAVVGNRDGALAVFENTTPLGVALTINVTPQNDLPEVTGLPGDVAVHSATPSAVDLSTLVVSDPDVTDTLELVLDASTGSLTAITSPDVAVSGSGSGTLTLSGTAVALNAFLADVSRLQFTNSDGHTSGDNAATIHVTLDDGTGVIDVGDVNVDIAPGNSTSSLTNLETTVVFDENVVNDVPQLLDPDVYFISMSDSFAGGLLTVTSVLAEDRLSVLNGGAGVGQVGLVTDVVMGTQEVTFSGQSIGTLTGGDGTTLTITFNERTSSTAIDALLQSLTYANSSDTPTASRTLQVQIIDAHGVGLTSGGAVAPSFRMLSGAANPLNGIDIGSYAASALADLTGDDRLDLIVGNSLGRFSVFENTGTGFTQMSASANPLNGIDIGSYSTPSFVDLEGDGRLDLVAGTSTGQFEAYHNTGSGFSLLSGAANPFYGVDIGSYSTPTFADIDGDGDKDMVTGDSLGRLTAYENTSDGFVAYPRATFPELQGAQDPFATIDIGSRSAPAFLDFDFDGDQDLFVATSTGVIVGFENTETGFVKLSETANPFTAMDVGSYGSLAFGDIEGDGTVDVVMGNNLGQLFVIENTSQVQRPVSITVQVVAENDAATAHNLPASVSATEDAVSVLDLSELTLNDPDSTTLTLLLSVAHGTLNAGAGTGISVTGSGTGSVRIVGTVAALNAYLQTATTLHYTGFANAAGDAADSLTISVDDGAGFVTLGTTVIDIAPVNDAPTAAGMLTSVSATEDMPSAIDLSGLVLTDEDGDTPLFLTITASAGSLTAEAGTGISVAGYGTGVLTLTGDPSVLNAYLAAGTPVHYTGAVDAWGPNAATLKLSLSDGIAASDLGALRVNIAAVNDAPIASGLPGALAVVEATASTLDLSSVTLSDPDSATLALTLSVGKGVLRADAVTGVSVLGSGSQTLTLTGATALLNAFLDGAGVSYTEDAGVSADEADTLSLTVNDGAGAVALPSRVITILAAADLPRASGLPAQATAVEDLATGINLSTLTLTNPDSTELIGLRLEVSAGTLSASVNGDVSVTGSGANSLTLNGTAEALTSWLDTPANLQYIGPENISGTAAASLSLTLVDPLIDISLGIVALNLTAVNDLPTGIGLPVSLSATEDVASTIDLSALILSDADTDDTLILVLSIDAGTLTATPITGATIAGSGSNQLSVTGTKDALNAWLSSSGHLSYTGAPNVAGAAAATLIATVDDQSGAVPVPLGAAAINITAVNDAPTASGLPTDVSAYEAVASAIDLSGLLLADVDSTTLTLRLVAGSGTLSAVTGGGVTIVGADSSNLTLTGTVAALNAWLADASLLFFTVADTLSGDNATTITVSVDDGSGAIVLGAINVDITELDGTQSLRDLAATVTFAKSAVNVGAQLIDNDVTYSNFVNAFDGGHLSVSGLLAEDVVSFRDGGTGAGQIGLSGSNVTYSGAVIGTVSGGAGNNFKVEFNSATTSPAVDALIENLTYANNSDAPTAIRTLVLDVIDASGSGLGSGSSMGPLSYNKLSGLATPLGGVDVGSYSAPAFVDLDEDSDLDMVAGDSSGRLSAFRNTGSGFTAITGTANPFNGIDVGSYSSPAFVDLDGDGDLDMVAGINSGQLSAFRKTGSGFTALTGTANPFNGIDVGSYSTPAFVDLDGDGNLDLVVGDISGRLSAFRNSGSGFTLLGGTANPFVGIDIGSRSAPSFADVDGDGDMDLFIGTGSGQVFAFENTDTGFTRMAAADDPFGGLDVGSYANPVFADLDGDGTYDFVIGNNVGQFAVFEGAGATPTGVKIEVKVNAENDTSSGAILAATEDTVPRLDQSNLLLADNERTDRLTTVVSTGTQSTTSASGATLAEAESTTPQLSGFAALVDTFLAWFVEVLDTAAAEASGAEPDVSTATISDVSVPIDLDSASVDIAAVDDHLILTGLSESVNLSGSAVFAGSQLIDPEVTFSGCEDSFSGGNLSVSGLLAEDLVSVRDAGNGPGAIGLSGETVTYGGMAIGTLFGGNGQTLTVEFTSDVTTAAVDALIESLTYGNISQAPTASRTLLLDVVNASGHGLGGGSHKGVQTFMPLTGSANPLNGIDVGSYGAPAFVDLDDDGRLDMVAGDSNGRFTAYHNNGSGFSVLSGPANPLNGIDVGSYGTPAFVDLDGDGRLDMVAGNSNGSFAAYHNSGSSFAALSGSANPFDGLDIGSYATPTFVDLNSDGRLDMVAGDSAGRLSAWHNTGSGYTALSGGANPFNGIDIGSRSAPAFADLDSDGDLDLLVGMSTGRVAAYENTGSGFNRIEAGDNPLNGIDVGSYANPIFADLDNDGHLDLIIGNRAGQFAAFDNNASHTQGFEIVLNVFDDFLF